MNIWWWFPGSMFGSWSDPDLDRSKHEARGRPALRSITRLTLARRRAALFRSTHRRQRGPSRPRSSAQHPPTRGTRRALALSSDHAQGPVVAQPRSIRRAFAGELEAWRRHFPCSAVRYTTTGTPHCASSSTRPASHRPRRPKWQREDAGASHPHSRTRKRKRGQSRHVRGRSREGRPSPTRPGGAGGARRRRRRGALSHPPFRRLSAPRTGRWEHSGRSAPRRQVVALLCVPNNNPINVCVILIIIIILIYNTIIIILLMTIIFNNNNNINTILILILCVCYNIIINIIININNNNNNIININNTIMTILLIISAILCVSIIYYYV